jgi:organic hydroperoxide reductase OsmC/OhrA
MAEKRHQYRAVLEWSDQAGTSKASTHTRDHVAKINAKPDLLLSADPGFRGDPARHNPEDLLLVSLSSCHMLWYLGLCARAGIAVTRYIDDAEGTMIEDAAAGGRFERVVLHPRVLIAAGDPAKARDLHREAHRMCFVANSVNFPVECEPTIEVAR